MADHKQPQVPNAPFPAPPPFWKHFSSENISRLKAVKESSSANSEQIPAELSYLVPPSPPEDSYTVFGEAQTLSTTLPPLSTRGITQLYPSPTPSNPNPIKHPNHLLLHLVRALHLNYLEAITILSQNPTLIIPKLEDLKNLFQNAHWIINMYRPHQARESLIEILEGEVRAARGEVEKLGGLGERVRAVLEKVEQEGSEASEAKRVGRGGSVDGKSSEDQSQDEKEDAKRLLWKMIVDIDVEAD